MRGHGPQEVEMNKNKTFPIQHPWKGTLPLPLTVPWHIAEEAYKEYKAQFGDQQSLERLRERGGFGWIEIIYLLFDRIVRIEGE